MFSKFSAMNTAIEAIASISVIAMFLLIIPQIMLI
jgi:hypothetical protein